MAPSVECVVVLVDIGRSMARQILKQSNDKDGNGPQTALESAKQAVELFIQQKVRKSLFLYYHTCCVYNHIGFKSKSKCDGTFTCSCCLVQKMKSALSSLAPKVSLFLKV